MDMGILAGNSSLAGRSNLSQQPMVMAATLIKADTAAMPKRAVMARRSIQRRCLPSSRRQPYCPPSPAVAVTVRRASEQKRAN